MKSGEIEALVLLAILFGLFLAGGVWAKVGISAVCVLAMIVWIVTRSPR